MPSSASTRMCALLAVGLLALGLSSGMATAQASDDSADLDGQAAGQWLVDQLQDGVVVNEEFGSADIGLTLDVVTVLNELGEFDSDVEETTTAVEEQLSTYIGFEDDVYAGSVAKSAVVLRAAGADPADVADTDLVALLESTVLDEDDVVGRIQDRSDEGEDFANTIGQAHAAQALYEADSELTGDVLEFLLDQQCSDGYFRLDFAPPDDPQSCDDDEDAEPNPDVTAQALIALQAIDTTQTAQAADRATTWLIEVQQEDGSFGGGAELPDPNANSTGLASRALAGAGEDDAARSAASWLGSIQLADGEDAGAIAGTQDEFSGADGDVAAEARDIWIRATAEGARAGADPEEIDAATDDGSGSSFWWFAGAGLAIAIGAGVGGLIWWFRSEGE